MSNQDASAWPVDPTATHYIREHRHGAGAELAGGWTEMKRIAVDFENSAEAWWDAARSADGRPAAMNVLLYTNETDVTVSDDAALDLIAWAESLPGWNDGPEHAPHPLTVHDA